MKNSTGKNSMRKVSAVLAMAMAMSAAVSTMAVTASATESESDTAVVCDCEDQAAARQDIPLTFRVEGVNGRVKDFHMSVTFNSGLLCPDSEYTKNLMRQFPHEEHNGEIICFSEIVVKHTYDGHYVYYIPGWADPSTIHITAGYNGVLASPNHDELIDYNFGAYNGSIRKISLKTSSWTKWWGGYGTAIRFDINGSTFDRGEG